MFSGLNLSFIQRFSLATSVPHDNDSRDSMKDTKADTLDSAKPVVPLTVLVKEL